MWVVVVVFNNPPQPKEPPMRDCESLGSNAYFVNKVSRIKMD